MTESEIESALLSLGTKKGKSNSGLSAKITAIEIKKYPAGDFGYYINIEKPADMKISQGSINGPKQQGFLTAREATLACLAALDQNFTDFATSKNPIVTLWHSKVKTLLPKK